METTETKNIVLVPCYECGKRINREGAKWFYHADQQDLLCDECAKKAPRFDGYYGVL